jgi:hypothetical protein
LLTQFQVDELQRGQNLKGHVPGGYPTLAALLDGWRQSGKRLLAGWAYRPPIPPTYTAAELEWRRANAERLGFPADGSPDPPDPWELDQRPFGQQVAEFVRDNPGRLPELAGLWESLAGRPHERRLEILRIVFNKEP